MRLRGTPCRATFKVECGQCHPSETCHKNNDHRRYTSCGCHEHSQAKARAEHVEEGIQNFENCVECHRDPRVEPEKRGGRERG